MKIVGILPVRNEAWVLGFSLRAMLMWMDEVVVLNHASTDGTGEILDEIVVEHPGRVTVLRDFDTSWQEMCQRQRLLEAARLRGGTHIAILDADEILCGGLLDADLGYPRKPLIRSFLETLPEHGLLETPIYNCRGGGYVLLKYHSNGTWGNRRAAIVFRDEPAVNWSGEGFHHRAPFGVRWNVSTTWIPAGTPIDAGGLIHLWGVSERRLLARHALYKIIERLRFPTKAAEQIDAYYNQAVRSTNGAWTFATTPGAWWEPYSHLLKHLLPNAEPWQEHECKRLWREHGAEKFAGLDLFGVV